MDSSVTLAMLKEGSEDYVKLYDVYNPGMELGGSVIITYLGIWNSARHGHCMDIINIESSKYLQRKNMTGINLRVATLVIYLLT